MINVLTIAEHRELLKVAQRELPRLRALGRPVISKDIDGYQVAADKLWEVQYYKCCYCECKIPKSFNDVEHYRPKGRADRSPGCTTTHGYWWLAFSLHNLLFACPSCNRSSKNDKFPLDVGGKTIVAEQSPPAGELPLLIDPAGEINPVENIRFIPIPFEFYSVRTAICDAEVAVQRWLAVPRRGSKFGEATIEVADLNRMELIELRSDYIRRTVWPLAAELLEALDEGVSWKVQDRMSRAEKLIRRGLPFTALAFDALSFFVPASLLDTYHLVWPAEKDVGVR